MAVSMTLESQQIRERPFVFIVHMKQNDYGLTSDTPDCSLGTLDVTHPSHTDVGGTMPYALVSARSEHRDGTVSVLLMDGSDQQWSRREFKVKPGSLRSVTKL
jgi:hypothetical protein